MFIPYVSLKACSYFIVIKETSTPPTLLQNLSSNCVNKNKSFVRPKIKHYYIIFTVNLLIVLFCRTDTFIGTNDIAVEDTWVNFDGSSIPGNGFLYTMTNYPVSQPNGLTSQNCAIINPKPGNSIYTTNQTQDRSCTSSLSTDMLCYREGKNCVIYILFKRVGLSWAHGCFRLYCSPGEEKLRVRI